MVFYTFGISKRNNMRKLVILLLLLPFAVFGQTEYNLKYDSIGIGKPAGTSGVALYGKVYLKNVGLGLVSDSILTVLNGRIRKIPVSGITPDSTVYRTVANSLSKAQIQTALNLKANLAGGNTFTGDQTINANLYLPFNRWMGYNNTAPLAPIHVGNRNVINSSNAQVLVAGTYDNTSLLSGHAFSDGTLITGITGSKAYAGYDGRVDIQGTGLAMDHYVSFQHGPSYNFTGTVTDNFGLYATSLFASGTVTNNYGAYLANPVKTSGVLTNNYGLYIANQTSGSNNFSIYSAGGFNYFGGSMQTEGTMSLNSVGQNLRLKGGGTGDTDAGIYVNGAGNIFFANWDGTRGFVTLSNGNGYYFGGNFGVKTATPSEALDVAGNALIGGFLKSNELNIVNTPITSVGSYDILTRNTSTGLVEKIASSTTSSGTYTPTLTNGANVASSTTTISHYVRIGNQVTVYGQINVFPTSAASVATVLNISLPVASNFTTITDSQGVVATYNPSTAISVRLEADDTNDSAILQFTATSGNPRFDYSFIYTVK